MSSKFKKFIRRLFGIPYWKPNKESRKMLKEEADKIIGWDKRSTNPAWSTSWKYFIKRQYPWFGLLELNQYKIIEMRDYMQNHSSICEEATEKQIREMTTVIDLGNKILADEYDYPFRKWSRTNSVNVTLIYERIGEKSLGDKNKIFLPLEGELLGKLYNREMFEDMKSKFKLFSDTEYDVTEEDLEQNRNYLKDKPTYSLKTWLEEHNLTEDKIVCAYTSEYTNGKSEKENKIYATKLLKQCWRNRKNDIAKYFNYIGKYSDHWGD